jgi:hypothetical protein
MASHITRTSRAKFALQIHAKACSQLAAGTSCSPTRLSHCHHYMCMNHNTHSPAVSRNACEEGWNNVATGPRCVSRSPHVRTPSTPPSTCSVTPPTPGTCQSIQGSPPVSQPIRLSSRQWREVAVYVRRKPIRLLAAMMTTNLRVGSRMQKCTLAGGLRSCLCLQLMPANGCWHTPLPQTASPQRGSSKYPSH